MATYVEGTDKGRLRFNDVEHLGECLFFLATDFTDRISCLHYNKEKNVFFAGSRDGKFRIWKVPKEWRVKEIDDIEREYEFARKQIVKIRESIARDGRSNSRSPSKLKESNK